MKIECLKNKLLNTISKASRLTQSRNSSLPILNCILLESKDNRLIVKSTNLDLGVSLEIPVKTISPGSIAVPGETLNGLLLNIPDTKHLKLESGNQEVKIYSEKTRNILKTRSTEDFPSIPNVKSEPFIVSVKDFVSGLKNVWYSCTQSSVKPELSSVFICTKEKEMIFAATDSFRLAEKRIKIEQNKELGDVLIPFKNAVEIVRMIEDEEGEISVFLDKNQISFSGDGIYLTSRLVDSTFPDYKQIIPKEFKTEATILKQDFSSALKLAGVFSDKFNQINLNLSPSKKTFEAITRNPERGESVYKIDSVLSGNDIEINFNLKYISDCMSSINSDSLSVSLNDISKPMIIKGIGDTSFLYLVMPMNK